MSTEDKKLVTVVAIRDFVVADAAYKTGDLLKVKRPNARAFVRRRAAAYEGEPEAEAAIAAAKANKKAPTK